MTIYIFMFRVFVNNVRTFHDTDAVFIVLIRVYVRVKQLQRKRDSIQKTRVLSYYSFPIMIKQNKRYIVCIDYTLQIHINQITFYYSMQVNQTHT